MDDTIQNALNHFGTAYKNDTVIYIDVEREHVEYTKYTIECLLEAELYLWAELR